MNQAKMFVSALCFCASGVLIAVGQEDGPKPELSLAKRQEIYGQAYRAGMLASNEAEHRFSFKSIPVDEAAAKRYLADRKACYDAAKAAGLARVRKAYGVDEKALAAIDAEGVKARWPLPTVSPSERPPAESSPAKPRRAPAVPDPSWDPTPGDRAEIAVEGTAGFPDEAGFDRFAASFKARDRTGVDKALSGNGVVRIERWTPVVVVRRFRPERVAVSGSFSLEEFGRMGQASSLTAAAQSQAVYPLEVRILEGPHAGTVCFVPEPAVARMIPVPGRRIRKGVDRPPLPKTVDPNAKAETALGMARGLEKAKKPAAALKYYRQVVNDFPGTPQAAVAAGRIKALEAKP